MIIKNGKVFTKDCVFENQTVVLEETRIIEMMPEGLSLNSDTTEILDADGCFIIPGLMDIHFHGCMGHDFCDATQESIDQIIKYQVSKGITTICPATMTLPMEDLFNICENAALYNENQPYAFSPLIGINMEGPFISKDKKGAQNPDYIKEANSKEIQQLQKASGDLIKLIAIAPETPGALNTISQLKNDFIFSLAHTTAGYNKSMEAFQAGANHVTHLYNAMPPFHHRDSGVIGAAFDTNSCFVELICDGVHITPSVIRATFQLFGNQRIALISDSMMACGMNDGNYSLGGQKVSVKGNEATLNDGTIAGSVTNLFDCMLHTISVGIPPEIAIKAATINPARSIGMEQDYGSLEVGKIADLLLLNSDYSLKSVILQGKLI